jgi:hypothetical protein
MRSVDFRGIRRGHFPGILRGVVVTLSLSTAVDAAAAPPVPEATESARTAVGLDLGIASAVGFGGVTLARQLGRHLRLEAGAGLGLSGLQLSVMPKLVLGDGHDHFVSGAGVSVAFFSDSQYVSGHPIWLNVDAVGYEHHFDNGIAVSSSVGLTGGLGGGQICLPPDGCEPQFFRDVTHYWGPQARAQLAYWF